MLPPWVLLLNLLIPLILGQTGLDNRCFLENGGSGENFFASEDLPLGSLIGSLRINGETGPRGNIELRLEEADSPVLIEPGTKNLTLVKKLDKEGEDGISSVYVHVLCTPRGSSDPIKIPVNIRVMDVNDNAPQFENGPYILNISEVTVVGTRVLQGVRARDKDQQGPFSTVQYTVLPGPNSDHFVFVNGLEGTLVLRKPLDYETLPNFTLTIRAQDQGNPPQYSDTTLFVNVIDADDQNPKFLDERYSAILPDHAPPGTILEIQPRDIFAEDQDAGIRSPVFYSFNSGGSDYKFFDIDQTTGKVSVKKRIPDDELLQPATLVVKATQSDNRDRYALATLAVSRAGTSLRELQFLQSHYLAGVLENVPLNSVLLTVITNRHRDKRLRFSLSKDTDMFGILPTGDIILRKSLDYETEDTYIFQVHATDGLQNATALVNISVLNVNDWDPRFRYPQYEFFLPGLSQGEMFHIPVGQVEAADGDRGDRISLSLHGPAARLFSIDDDGTIRILDLNALNSSTVHLVAVATDTGTPPRQASVPVIIHLPEAVVWRGGFGSNVILMSVLGGLLGLLAIIILALILYIHKHRKPKSKNQLATTAQVLSAIENEKLPPPRERTLLGSELSLSENNNLLDGNLSLRRGGNMTFASTQQTPSGGGGGVGKVENPVFTQNGGGTFNGSTASQYTATVKSIISRGMAPGGGKPPGSGPSPPKKATAPSPPQLPGSGGVGGTRSSSPTTHRTTPTLTATTRLWPPASIPRTVKKLSWDDESDSSPSPSASGPGNNKVEIDPDVSVTPLGDIKASENMNLTVYF